jgi:maltose/moltooligosaccharide transporter
MWTYATPALTEHVFNAADPASSEYQVAANLVSSYMGTYGLSSMAFALLLTFIAGKVRINRKFVHMGSLIIGGFGFIYMYFVKDYVMLQVSFACIGIAWGSILSMPYAMLSGSIDAKKMGLFMGLFNMFIVIPQIVAALGGINWAYKSLLGEATINTMILAGLSLILAGLCNLLITEKEAIK